MQYILVTDKQHPQIKTYEDMAVVSAADYISNSDKLGICSDPKLKIINLCSNFDYLSKGYYCSLLAEARGQKIIPSAQDIIKLHWKRLYQSALPELNSLLEKTFKESLGDEVEKVYLIYFGRTENTKLQAVAGRIFDIFRFPIIAIHLKYTDKWSINKIEARALDDIPTDKWPSLNEALTRFTGTAWARRFKPSQQKYWLAVLHDPKEKMPPSNNGALKKLIQAGKKENCFVDLITKADLPLLLEYDALFLRETTAIENHTFRFAHKAESEGIPVIDDTVSIIRCCNKVFLHEFLQSHKIPVPKTWVLDRKRVKQGIEALTFPFILKIPNGSFSRGVHKVETPAEFRDISRKLFEKSEIILAQEYVPSTYDWRIGILAGQPLFATQYHMVKGHWQIYQHLGEKVKKGAHTTVPIKKVPVDVLEIAKKAAKYVGNGFYGVDLKMTDNGVYVIEINDNPSLDSGVEDQIIGDKLYQKIIGQFIDLIEMRQN